MNIKPDLRGEQLIYGDFSRLLSVQVTGDMAQISSTYRELKKLDKSLYIGFVTYLLARAGYCNQTICEKWRINSKIYSLEHNCEICPLNQKLVQDQQVNWSEWIQNSFAWAEEVNELWDKFGETVDQAIEELMNFFGSWSNIFVNQETQRKIKVIFTDSLPGQWTDISDRSSRWTESDEFNIKDLKNWQALNAIDPSCANYVLVRPQTYKDARKQFSDRLQQIIDKLAVENIQLLSIDEFADKFVPRENKDIELTKWVNIRTEILESLKTNNPILIIALEWEKINNIESHLKKARQEFENPRDNLDYENAVRNATKAVEELLQVLYHKHFGKKPEGLTWQPLQDKLREILNDEFGDVILSDLSFLKSWRNDEVHPSDSILTKNIVLQVITRSEAFYEAVKATLSQIEFSRLRLLGL